MEFTDEQITYMTERFMELQEKDKEVLRKFFRNSKEARLLRMIMGPQVMNLLAEIRSPRRGIAAPR